MDDTKYSKQTKETIVKKAQKQEKLSEALRENLKRRKKVKKDNAKSN